jgi:hypothetical protein
MLSHLSYSPETMERVTGIEPATPAWKAGALPLCNTRKFSKTYNQYCLTYKLDFISSQAKFYHLVSVGARDGSRTRTMLPPADFKSAASAIPPLEHLMERRFEPIRRTYVPWRDFIG